ncbi:putative mediator of RNA polymerase II transcription subunit 26 [Drosophila innubila]|uniref:putative mediator of RNA polymerase II transcription subunit 26 n=1 Tax=Drosophila innubila TaxID=198719 RepID=UPI00148D06A1|nr:putative mediator of RNA polymerase II transcription subunit 26 [Drosophila innubila]
MSMPTPTTLPPPTQHPRAGALRRLTLLFALTVLCATVHIEAVVHGIQPLSNHYDLSTGNRNGYRYNGPAHKYLPAASAPATEAVTTTGHWQPNPVQSQQLLEQQTPYEHTFSSKPMLQQQGFNGPYNMQYYGKEEQQQQQLGNAWRQQQQQQQQQQLSANSYRKEQQQQLSGNSWQQQQHQKPQHLSDNLPQKEQQQQLSGNSWQQQQHQKPQQLSGNSWQQQQHQKPQQFSGSSWQQQQHEGRQEQQQHLESQQQHSTLAQHNNNNLNTFPYAGNNKIAAASATMDQLGASYHVSIAANSDRYLDSDMRDNQLMTQALPAPYQQQLFASQKPRQPGYEPQLGGSANFVQMQSNSYELPASYHTQSEYSEKYRPQMDYDALRQKEMPLTGYHYKEQVQPDYLHDTSSHAHSTAHLTFQPSREFQAPYF